MSPQSREHGFYGLIKRLRQDQIGDSIKTIGDTKLNCKIINKKTSLFFNDKEILIVACYDVIKKLSK